MCQVCKSLVIKCLLAGDTVVILEIVVTAVVLVYTHTFYKAVIFFILEKINFLEI